jgi:hypothetical protein
MEYDGKRHRRGNTYKYIGEDIDVALFETKLLVSLLGAAALTMLPKLRTGQPS